MSDLRALLDDLRAQIENLPSSATASQIGPLETKARDLLTRSKNTSFEEEARELFSELSRRSAPSKNNPETGQVRSLLRRARIRIEIAGDDHDFDEAIDILAQALDLDPDNGETHELLIQAAQHSSQHALKVQGLADRYGIKLESNAPPPATNTLDYAPASNASPSNNPAPSHSNHSSENSEAESRLSEIASAYYAGDYQRTVDLASRLLEFDPNNNQAREYREKADDNLMRGVVPDHRIPFDARVAYNRANSLVRAGNYAEAERLYREAREVAERAGIHTWKDVEQALLEIQDLALARELLGDGDRLLAADDWQGALAKYEGSWRVVPNDPLTEERIQLVKKVQEQYDQATVRLGMITGTLTERARGLVDLLNVLSGIRQILPGSARLQQMVNDTQARIQNVKLQLLEQGENLLSRVEAITSVEEKHRQAEESRDLFDLAVELDSSDARATAGLRKAQQYTAELREGRQLMERSAALIAQNFDNELAQARQMLSGLRHNAQDARYQQLVSDLLSRHIERVEAAIDRRDIDGALRWLSICKEDPFRILGRRAEILRLENEVRGLKQGRLLRRLLLVGLFLGIIGVIAFLNRSSIERIVSPTQTPTATASNTGTATATNTPTDTPTPTNTATNTPLPPDDLTATANARSTITALTQVAIINRTGTAEQLFANQEGTQAALDLTATQDDFNNRITGTIMARTQAASATNIAQTEQARGTQDYFSTQTATFMPPTLTPTLTNTPPPSPTPTEPVVICAVFNPNQSNVNVRSMASPNGNVVAVLIFRQTAEVIRQTRGTDGAIWYRITIQQQDAEILGWISSSVVQQVPGQSCPPYVD